MGSEGDFGFIPNQYLLVSFFSAKRSVCGGGSNRIMGVHPRDGEQLGEHPGSWVSWDLWAGEQGSGDSTAHPALRRSHLWVGTLLPAARAASGTTHTAPGLVQVGYPTPFPREFEGFWLRIPAQRVVRYISRAFKCERKRILQLNLVRRTDPGQNSINKKNLVKKWLWST